MQESTFTNYDQLPLFLNANAVAQVLGVSISSAYELMHEDGFPALRIVNEKDGHKSEKAPRQLNTHHRR